MSVRITRADATTFATVQEDLDPEQTAAKAKAEEQRLEQVKDLREILSSKAGRRFVWRLLERAGVYRTSFNNSGSVTAFNEGKRDIGLFLLGEMGEAAPDGYLAMLKEHMNDD